MGIELLFTDIKWNILKILFVKEFSPLEIMEGLKITISDISQQFRVNDV